MVTGVDLSSQSSNWVKTTSSLVVWYWVTSSLFWQHSPIQYHNISICKYGGEKPGRSCHMHYCVRETEGTHHCMWRGFSGLLFGSAQIVKVVITRKCNCHIFLVHFSSSSPPSPPQHTHTCSHRRELRWTLMRLWRSCLVVASSTPSSNRQLPIETSRGWGLTNRCVNVVSRPHPLILSGEQSRISWCPCGSVTYM